MSARTSLRPPRRLPPEGVEGRRISDSAYDTLKGMIIALDLRPGQPLNERRLMDLLEVGRTPLREALLRLAAEGLVIVHPRRGTYLVDVNLQDIRQILELRLELEPLCASWAALRISEADLVELKAIIDHHRGSLPPKYSFLIDLNFHRLINRASGNRFLAATLELLQVLSLRLFRYTGAERETPDETRRSHQRIFAALKRRDPMMAATAMQEHVLAAKARLMAGIEGRARSPE